MNDRKSAIGFGMFDIAEDMIDDVEELCLENLHMDRESLPATWRERLAQTHEEASETFVCKGMFEAFLIERVDGNRVYLESGNVLESEVLAEALSDAREVVAFAVAVHGFEDLCGRAVNSGMMLMLYGGWGVGFSRGSRIWLEGEVRKRAHEKGLHTGMCLFPGEGGVAMAVQDQIAGLLDLAVIGLEIKADYIMHPTMSLTGFIPVSENAGANSREGDA